jgi:hypothetical protein
MVRLSSMRRYDSSCACPQVRTEQSRCRWPVVECLRQQIPKKFRTCMCPSAVLLSLSLGPILSVIYALAAPSNVLCGCGEERVASRRRIRIGRERHVEGLLWLRVRGWIASVGLRLRLVVRIMAIFWRALERSGLAGVHGARDGVRASERRTSRQTGVRVLKQNQGPRESDGRGKQSKSNDERERRAKRAAL